jgi:hypothetical protein
MAANSSGVYLTYFDPGGNLALTQLNSTLTTVIASRSLTLDYGFSAPSMATVRSFNNRTFLCTRDGTSIEVRELSGVNVINTASISTLETMSDKSVDLAYDSVSNTLYLAYIVPGDVFKMLEVRAFSSMSLGAGPTTIVSAEISSDYGIAGLGASNDQVFCSLYMFDVSATSLVVDARSSLTRNPGYTIFSFGSDSRQRMRLYQPDQARSNNRNDEHADPCQRRQSFSLPIRQQLLTG